MKKQITAAMMILAIIVAPRNSRQRGQSGI